MSRTWKQIICTILIPVMLLGIFPIVGMMPATEAYAAVDNESDYRKGISEAKEEMIRNSSVEWFWPTGPKGKPSDIDSPYGHRKFNGGTKDHYAIDILKGSTDGTIYAAYDGTVYRVIPTDNSDAGINIVLMHENVYEDGDVYYTQYMHLSKILNVPNINKQNKIVKDKNGNIEYVKLEKGVKVKKGTPIAKMGSTGNSTGTHLDFRIYRGKFTSSYKYTQNTIPGWFNGNELSASLLKTLKNLLTKGENNSRQEHWVLKYTTSVCKHESDNSCYDPCTGICKECDYNYYDNHKTACTGYVSSKLGARGFYVYNAPYGDSGRVKIKGKELFVKSAKLVSWGENFYKGSDHIWYEISVPGYDNLYYVNSNNVLSNMNAGFKFNLVMDNFKACYTAGTKNNVYIKGTTVTSTSEANISSILAQIIDCSSNKVLYTYTKEKINSKSWTFDEAIDIAMGFSKIKTVGNYKYVITATDANGGVGSNTTTFKVVAKGQSTQVVHSVSFSANNGYNAPETQQVSSGQPVNLNVKDPVRQGYSFAGWSLDSSSTYADITKSTGYTPTSSVTLYAVWNKIPVPSAPTMTNMTYNIGLGRTVSVSWNSTDYANSYIASVYASNGNEILDMRQELNGTFTTFMFDSAGTYTIRVRAKNVLGEESENSGNCITAVVHPSSTVTFKNYDGCTLATHEVVYGDSTTQPNSPTRTGYDFIGWSGSFLNVTENRTITAQYKPKDYTVTFYDCDGDALPIQTVHYSGDTPGSAAEPAVSQLAVPHGYTFVGWDSTERTSVTRAGIEVRPVYVWTNNAVPISSVINSVTAAGQGYWVDYTITNHVNEARLGRVVILAKNQYGKFICQTESGAFYLGGKDESINSRIYVYVNEKDETAKAELFSSITTVELLVVDSYEEMIPIAEPVTRYTPDRESKLWSDWMTKAEYNALDNTSYTNYETKTQYRVSRREEKTSNYSSLDGYTRLDSRTTSYKSSWSNWSEWSTTPVYASANVDVETRTVTVSNAYTEYRYGTLKNKAGTHDCQNVSGNYGTVEYTPWSTTRYQIDSWMRYSKRGYNYLKSDGVTVTYREYTGGYYYWDIYYKPGVSHNRKSNGYFWEETKNVPAQTQIQYRYRTRSDVNVYTFERWSGYGSWSDTYTASDGNTQVQTQKLYRVCMKAVTPKEGAYEYTVNVPEAAGKQAIFSVYKVDQASDYSNEYMEQVTLDADGKHTFVFDTLKECTADTGDFTMTLTIEGSSNPLYVGTILAPRKEYTVNFVDMDGTYIGEPQTVQEGYAVTAPEAPYHEGYVFLGWEYGLTNIRDDMDIQARYIPKEYVVVYLDWLNGTANMVTGISYGSKLELPEPEAPEGYTFIGWKTPKGLSADSVSDNMIVTAEFEQQVVNVTFTDANGEVIDESEVPYGELPVDPLTDFYQSEDTESEEDGELLTSLNGLSYDPDDDAGEEEDTIESILSVPEGMYFAGWAEDAYCPATQELVLTPTLEYNESAEEATVSLESGLYYGPQTLEISCENENTEFTYGYISIEGTDETESSIEYTGPITVDRSCVIKVSTTEEGKGSTEIRLEYTILSAESKPGIPENVAALSTADGVALTWNAVAGAQGYYISKTDGLGNEERFMSDTNSYTDANVRELCEYGYTVTAYSKYETDYAELLLESDSSAEVNVKHFGSCAPVETVAIQNAPERMYDGSTVQLSAAVTPDNAYDSDVVWLTDSECLYVTEEGLLMASGSGTGTVTALAADGSGASDTKQVVVVIPESGGATLTVSSAELVRDNPSEVTVTLSENSGVAAMQFVVLYDSSQIELVSCSEGSALSGKSPTINSTIPGVIYVNWDGLEPLYSGGELLKLSFRAKSGISKSQMAIEIPTESDDYEFVFSDANHTDITAAAVNGVLSVSEFILGDVNSDGNINVIDANLIRRYAARFTDVEFNEIQKLNADVNGDGKINVLDASLIRRYAAKLIDEFPNAG